jgi:hypothetical protein
MITDHLFQSAYGPCSELLTIPKLSTAIVVHFIPLVLVGR